MNGYLLIWILLQKIEKLEEELNTYRNSTSKNWFISSEQFLPALFFYTKKDMCSPHISSVATMNGYLSLKLNIVYYIFYYMSNDFWIFIKYIVNFYEFILARINFYKN